MEMYFFFPSNFTKQTQKNPQLSDAKIIIALALMVFTLYQL